MRPLRAIYSADRRQKRVLVLALAATIHCAADVTSSPASHTDGASGGKNGGSAGFPKPTYLSIAEHSGGWQLGFIKLSGSPTGERQAYPMGQMPVARWSCLEWELNDQPDEIHLWGDGLAIGALDPDHVDYPAGHTPGAPIFNNASSGLVGGFTQFGVGFYDWHPSGFEFDLYYDDIVLDTKRVGCL